MEYTNVGHLGLVVSRLCLGTMNFGPHTTEEDSHRLMDTRRGARHQLLRHRERVRALPRRRCHRGDHRPVVRPRGAAGARRWCSPPRCTARPATGPTNPGCPSSRSARPARPRCDACGTDYIDLYQMHHIDREGLVGRDLGGDGAAEARGQDPLRRLVELRRMAHRARQRDRRLPPLPGPGHRAVALQPHRAHGRARGDPRRAGVRHGTHRYSPLAGGLLAGALQKVDEGRRNEEYMRGEIEANRAAARTVGGALRRDSANVPRTSRSRGSCTSPRSPRPSSGHAPRNSCWVRCGR